MLTWTTIGLLAGFFTAAGVVVDRLWLRRKKPALHHKLTEWWLRLDASKIGEIPKLMAGWVLGLGKQIFRWPLLSWQTLVLLLIASWILTTASTILGYMIDTIILRVNTYDNLVDALPFYWIYITNLPFDIITIMVTGWILRFVLRSSVVKSMAAVLFDILIAALLVWICMASIIWIDDRAAEYNFPGYELFLTEYVGNSIPSIQQMALDDGFSKEAKVKKYAKSSFLEILSHTRKDYVTLFLEGTGASTTYNREVFYEIIEGQRSEKYVEPAALVVTWRVFLVATTSFIPTFAYMTAMLIFLLAAMMVKATMHLLELATQSDPRTHPEKFIPFTLLGSLFGLMAIFAKLMAHLVA